MSEPAEVAAVARKLLEVISHPLHELSTSSSEQSCQAYASVIRGWQQQTPYGQPTDWVFPSTRLKGKQPRVANMLVEDYLRPAAVKVGVLKEGENVRFGYHTLRHSLASFLVRKGTDVKTVQRLLRHSDVSTTLGIYAHSMSEDRLTAQGDMLEAMMKPPSDSVN